MGDLPFEYSLSELCDMADEIDSKAYYALCEKDLRDEKMREALLKIINSVKKPKEGKAA